MNKYIIILVSFILGSVTVSASQNSYMELADSAEYYIGQELWNKAEEKIIEALRLEPANFNNALLLSNLGTVRTHKEEYDKAIEAYTLALSISPASTTLHNNRARAYILNNNLPEALADIDKSLQLDSIQEWPLQTRGLIYLQDNRLEEAAKVFSTLKRNFPDNSIAFSGLATLFTRQGDIDKALEFYDLALKKDPSDEDTLCNYVFLLIETEKYSEARALLRKAISDNPENPMLYLLRGYIHRLNYLLNEAQADKKTAIEKGIDPSYASQFIP